MPFCVQCGSENPEGAKYCSNCGASLPAAPTPPSASEPEVPVARKRRKKKGKKLIIIGAIFSAFVCVVVIVAVAIGTGGTQQTATTMSQPSSTLPPTDTRPPTEASSVTQRGQPTRPATATPTASRTASPTATPTAVFGSRKNPVPIGQSFTWHGGDRKVEMVVVRVVYGEEAKKMVREANQFNSMPGEGLSFALVYVTCTYLEGSEEKPWGIDESDFTVSTNNELARAPSIVDPSPSFEWTGYPGLEKEGWMTFMVYADDPTPMLIFRPDYSGVSEGVWFALR